MTFEIDDTPCSDRFTTAVHLLAECLAGRPDAYAIQKKNGEYLAIRQPLTHQLLKKHVLGSVTIGTYVLNSRSLARYGVYDFDDQTPHTLAAIIWLRRWFDHWGITLAVEFSGKKGFHVWIVLKARIPAFKIVHLLKVALNKFEDETGGQLAVEVFPKQTMLTDLGSLVKLPWGVHRVSGKRSFFLDDNFKPISDMGLELINDLPVITEEVIDGILNELPEFKEDSNQMKCKHLQQDFTALLNNPVSVGQRRPTLVSLSGYLRTRGIPEDVAVALLQPWAEKQFVEPLPQDEIIKHIHGIYKRYGVREVNFLPPFSNQSNISKRYLKHHSITSWCHGTSKLGHLWTV